MCDKCRVHWDKFRIDSSERTTENTAIDQQRADWLAPMWQSFLFGVGAAAIDLTLGEEDARAAKLTGSDPPVSGPSVASLALNGPITPYVSADTDVSESGYETLKQPTTQPKGLWPGTENGLPEKPYFFIDIKSNHALGSGIGSHASLRFEIKRQPAASAFPHPAIQTRVLETQTQLYGAILLSLKTFEGALPC
jgi:hypothetical protein